MPKYENIEIQLSSVDGNAFSIIGKCLKSMKESDLPKSEQNKFLKEATASNYDNLIQVCMKWFYVW